MDFIKRLVRIREARKVVEQLPKDQFRKLLEEQLLDKEREIVGNYVQWVVTDEKTEQ